MPSSTCRSASGHSTQEDPIGLAGGLNLYGYADGDPINFSDPFGQCAEPSGRTYNNTGAKCKPLALGTGTRRRVLGALDSVRDTPLCRKAANLIREKVANGAVKVYSVASYREPGDPNREEHADYHPDTKEVHLNAAAFETDRGLAHDLMHEAFHAITGYVDAVGAANQGESNLANKFANTCIGSAH